MILELMSCDNLAPYAFANYGIRLLLPPAPLNHLKFTEILIMMRKKVQSQYSDSILLFFNAKWKASCCG